ncbi:MAG: transposase [Bryobacteraceae bacterium]
MPRSPRCLAPGLPYHITQRGTNGEPIFLKERDRKVYLRLLASSKNEAGVRILSWCLMSNHVHLVAVPEAENSLAVLLHRLHGRYAQMFNKRHNRTGHLFQGRFFSCPLDSSLLWRAVAYVERNPVRAGMVERAEQYPWSSAAVHLGLERDRLELLDLDFWLSSGGAERWRELLISSEDPAQLRLLRRCTSAGRPFGSGSFLQAMEERFGRRWRRWGFEGNLRGESRKAGGLSG